MRRIPECRHNNICCTVLQQVCIMSTMCEISAFISDSAKTFCHFMSQYLCCYQMTNTVQHIPLYNCISSFHCSGTLYSTDNMVLCNSLNNTNFSVTNKPKYHHKVHSNETSSIWYLVTLCFLM
jgi:hypothetical protein